MSMLFLLLHNQLDISDILPCEASGPVNGHFLSRLLEGGLSEGGYYGMQAAGSRPCDLVMHGLCVRLRVAWV